jgi:hypothetical protein
MKHTAKSIGMATLKKVMEKYLRKAPSLAKHSIRLPIPKN